MFSMGLFLWDSGPICTVELQLQRKFIYQNQHSDRLESVNFICGIHKEFSYFL